MPFAPQELKAIHRATRHQVKSLRREDGAGGPGGGGGGGGGRARLAADGAGDDD